MTSPFCLAGPAGRAVSLLLRAALVFLVISAGVFARGAVVIPEGPNPKSLPEGELLLGELNCAACHRAPGTTRDRVNPRVSPSLEQIGSRVTGSFIRAFLTDPIATKPGTTMPDMLGGLDSDRRKEVVDALTHYLAAQRGPAITESESDDGVIQEGRRLYHQIGCVACHAPQDNAGALFSGTAGGGSDLAALAAKSVPFGDLARKYSVGQLIVFLRDPVKWRPSGRMPSMNLSFEEARAVAMYLLRDQVRGASGSQPARVAGLAYAYYEAEIKDDASNMDSLKPVKTGTVAFFDISPRRRQEQIGFLFKGTLTIPRQGEYGFSTTSDDGSRLYIDGQLAVQNDGNHPPETKSGRIRLTAGEHAIRGTFFNGGAGLELKVTIEGPGLGRREIPAEMLSHTSVPMRPLDLETVGYDAAKVMAGRGYFTTYGCAACHAIGDAGPVSPEGDQAKPLSELNPDNSGGCLGAAPAANAARFALTDGQRTAIARALADKAGLDRPLAKAERAERLLTVYGCYSCHSRDGVGGPAADRADYFRVVGTADLGDEGRIPPHLTRTGFKLRPGWLSEVLVKGTSVRPYMATRMPVYDAGGMRELAALLVEVDKGGNFTAGPKDADEAYRKAGRKLAGAGGFSCVSCHLFAGHESLGIPAMDLTWMSRRLNPQWFHVYLLDPPSLRPGTRMPAFWPGKKSPKPEVLGGDADAQIDAIWAYLSEGPQAKLPDGLTKAGIEIAATNNEAVIYRNFIEGAGSRAIGVGYPEKADLAFDANNMDVELVWHGKFIDAERHRNGRGEGFQGPLGDDAVKLNAFPSFAELKEPGDPWPQAAGKSAGYQMHGYVLDTGRRPEFLYTYKGIKVEDFSKADVVNDDPVLRREIRLNAAGSPPKLYFLAARGDHIDVKNEGLFVVDGKVTIKLQSGGAAATVRKEDGRYELLVPVEFFGGQALIKEEFSW